MVDRRASFVFVFLLFVSCQAQVNKPTESGTIFPAENFSLFEGKRVDGKPVVGNVNNAYSDYPKKAEYPWCLTLNIALDQAHLFPNGLPKSEESAVANQLEDELFGEIKTRTVAHYVAHVYGDEFLDVYIYLQEPKKVNEYLQTQINKKGLVRPFRYEIKEDKGWDTVKDFFNRK